MLLSNADKYRAKAYELVSLAERAGDPEQRADFAAVRRDVDESYGANRKADASENAA
jgi:hypothetical protein